MKRTGPFDLLLPFVIIGISTYVLLKFSYDSLPPLGYFAPVPLTVLAIIELVVARRASSLVGAALAGAAVALLIRVAPDAGVVRVAASDTKVGLLFLGSTILILAAGLLLERAGIDPNRDRRDRSQ